MQSFQKLYDIACERKGGEEALESLLSSPRSAEELTDLPDSFFLAEMTRRIFQAGFVWKVINNKWEGFQAAFHDFDPLRNAAMSPEEIDQLKQDKRIVRNGQKILTVRENALMIMEASNEYGGFGGFLAQWPQDDLIGLFDYLKKNGSRLGGNTGPLFLRFVGKDAFLLTSDVIRVLKNNDIIDKKPTSKKALKKVQEAFNHWHQESGRPFCQISRIMACTVGENYPLTQLQY